MQYLLHLFDLITYLMENILDCRSIFGPINIQKNMIHLSYIILVSNKLKQIYFEVASIFMVINHPNIIIRRHYGFYFCQYIFSITLNFQ